jgi:hypothetical protein
MIDSTSCNSFIKLAEGNVRCPLLLKIMKALNDSTPFPTIVERQEEQSTDYAFEQWHREHMQIPAKCKISEC